MFDDTPQSSSKKGAPPEDIFSGIDNSTPSAPAPTAPPKPAEPQAAPNVQKPKKEHMKADEVPPPAPTNPPAGKPIPPGLGDNEKFSAPPRPVVAPQDAMQIKPMARHSGSVKKIAVVGVIAVLVIIAAVLLASLFLRSRSAIDPIETEPVVETTSVTTPIEDLVTQPSSVIPGLGDSEALGNDLLLGGSEDVEEVAIPVDSDRDGLTDEEELALGTSIRSADTDSDGLSDKDEVKAWGTNPLNPDTDGDGYIDGDEVDNGFDPKGSGKLFEIP